MNDPSLSPELSIENIVRLHVPHKYSFRGEESREPYNEESARADFGDEFFNTLVRDQASWFRGDWWQLALLRRVVQDDGTLTGTRASVGVCAWNRFAPDLGARRKERIHLEGARLDDLNLSHTQLFGAHLEGASLRGARLEHAILQHAHLRNAIFNGARLTHANLQGARADLAAFQGADLEHASLLAASLKDTTFFLANLNSADMRFCKLSRAVLLEANMSRARVRRAEHILFDATRVEGIEIEGNAPDPWSVLRRTYTGPWFFVHLLLMVIFFAPYVGRAVYLTALSRMEEWSIRQYEKLGEQVQLVEAFREPYRQARERFERSHEPRRAVWIALGWDRTTWPLILATVVIVYNLLRGYLTLQVSMLRDAEERSATTPSLVDYYGRFNPISNYRWYRLRDWRTVYRSSNVPRLLNPLHFGRLVFLQFFGLYRLHYFARVLLWLAIASVAANSYLWARDTYVWVPIEPA